MAAPTLLAPWVLLLLLGLPAASAADAIPLDPGRIGAPLAPARARSAWGAVASDTEESSRAAVAVLEAGGNAIDAAVAGALAVGAAAPGSSGLGGQAWMLVHTEAGEDVVFFSPLRAPPRVDVARARAAKRDQVMTGPLALTVPGMVATLARAHGRFGTRPWAELVAPAIAVAEAGYRVSESERLFLLLYRDRIESSPSLRPLYLTGACDEDGLPVPVPVGHRVVYPGLARTLRRLAEAGPDDFYRGALASEIAADLARHSAFVRRDDLARVPSGIEEAFPVRGRYRDLDVLSLPEPGGGALVLQALRLLDAFPSGLLGEQAWARSQAVVESIRTSYADARARALSDRETTHLSVVDGDGNAVSLTLSLGRTWGSTYVTPGLGFPYNSFLEAFDLDTPGSAAYLRPGALATTAVAPTIFLRNGRPVLVTGAAGSTRITSAIVNVAVGVFDRGLGVAEAVAAPRASWSEGGSPGLRLEVAPPVTLEDVDFLRAAGYADLVTCAPALETTNFGALNAVGWDPAGEVWEAGAEPRRQGVAAVPGRKPLAGRAGGEVRP